MVPERTGIGVQREAEKQLTEGPVAVVPQQLHGVVDRRRHRVVCVVLHRGVVRVKPGFFHGPLRTCHGGPVVLGHLGGIQIQDPVVVPGHGLLVELLEHQLHHGHDGRGLDVREGLAQLGGQVGRVVVGGAAVCRSGALVGARAAVVGHVAPVCDQRRCPVLDVPSHHVFVGVPRFRHVAHEVVDQRLPGGASTREGDLLRGTTVFDVDLPGPPSVLVPGPVGAHQAVVLEGGVTVARHWPVVHAGVRTLVHAVHELVNGIPLCTEQHVLEVWVAVGGQGQGCIDHHLSGPLVHELHHGRDPAPKV